jgi:hypothetical protein
VHILGGKTPLSHYHPLKEAILNLSSFPIVSKAKKIRLRPDYHEGLNIQYRLKDSSETFVGIGNRLGVSFQSVSAVTFGRRHSAKIEAEIARILGKVDWNEVVLEARSAVTGKPAKELIREMAQKRTARDKAVRANLAAAQAKAAAGKPRPKAPSGARRAG